MPTYVIIHGPPCSGKTLNREALRKHYKCGPVFDHDLSGLAEARGRILILTESKPVLSPGNGRLALEGKYIPIEEAKIALGAKWQNQPTARSIKEWADRHFMQLDGRPGRRFDVGDCFRLPNQYPAGCGGRYRIWKVTGVHLGALNQESSYALKPLDRHEGERLQIPCRLLESHPGIERL